MVVFADKSRKTELIEIWQRSFGDTEEYIRMFFEWNFDKIKIIICEVKGKAVSVAYLLPVTYEKEGQVPIACWYLYAAATLPEFRGFGYFGEIMKFIHDNIDEPVLLVPGEPSLVSFYEKMNMQVWLEEKMLDVTCDSKTSAVMRDITPHDYASKREKSLLKNGYIKWDEHFMEYICHENMVCGGFKKSILINDVEYIVMYRQEGDSVRVLEVLPQAKPCIQYLLKETGCERAKVCLQPTVMITKNFELGKNQGYFNLTLG